MNVTSRLFGPLAIGAFGGLFGLGFAPQRAPAQETGLQDENEVVQDLAALGREYSAFRLFGEGDRAVTGMRPTGNMEYFVTNTGIVDAADLNIDTQPDLFGCPTCPRNMWFDVSPIYAAPRSEWVRFLALVPELANATGGGYAYSRNFPTLGKRELLASDNQFGILFSGVETTEDGGCQDFSAAGPSSNSMDPGLTLLAGSNCPPTFPLVAGVPTFLGDHPISADAYVVAKATQGSDFQFEWWSVDPSLIDQSKFFGNFQTYGAYDDFNSDMIERFGNVVPGQAGDPLDEGWPLGLRTEFNAFTFALPTVANSMIWRAVIINETEKVYGVPLDYENLYIGYTIMPIRTQETVFYAEVWRGAILTAEGGTGSPNCSGVAPPSLSFIDCANDIGYDGGATGEIILKSPIGDLRNVLFTCSPSENAQRAAERAIPCPTDAFFDPTNVHAGDTITYNHFRMCPFGACHSETFDSGRDRQAVGGIASNTEDVLNGRAIGDLDVFNQYGIFRNPNYPQEPTPFAFWVPGTWDYSANGPTSGGDTLFVSTCYGPPGVTIEGATRENRVDACVVTWADTMPVGELGNPAYNNQEGNISYWGVGPFRLAAGDTTALVIAMVAGTDSTTFEAEVNNVIDLYMNFYLSPEAPPKVTIVGARADVENPAEGRGNGEVELFWDDASDEFVDAFLEDFADKMEAAAAGDLARIRDVNKADTVFVFDTVSTDPLEIDTTIAAIGVSLVERIRARARDNLEQILVFKSCDGGNTFTARDTDIRGDLDCDADEAEDIQGTDLGPGWQAYATLPVDVGGDAPNSFLDNLVVAGQAYLYVVAGETRGATLTIKDSVDIDGDGSFDALAPDSLVLAPSLINPLSRSLTEPNVVSVYVPATVQAGSQAAEATLVAPDPGRSTVPFDVTFTGTATTDDRYQAIFGNQFRIVQLVDNATGGIDSTSVTVRDVLSVETSPTTVEDSVVDSAVFGTANPNGVTLAGTPTSVTVIGTGAVDTTETILDGLGFLLVRETANEPLLTSILLDSVKTTAPEFFGRQAVGAFTGFPGFIVVADNTEAGDFEEQEYRTSTGAVVPDEIEPAVTWRNQESVSNQAGGITAFGEYVITWVDLTFGPGSPFRLNEADPSATDADYDASLAARGVGQTGRTDDAAAAAIAAATGQTVIASDLVPVRVPFTVQNVTFGRSADVAMIARDSSSVLLGDVNTADTLSVTVAPDVWIPGDELFFIETVDLDSIGASGGVVLDPATDQPIKVQSTVATFAPAVLSCGNNPRPSCNPVVGEGATDDWVSNAPGQSLNVLYNAPFQLNSELVFDVQGEITGDSVVARGRDIRAQVDSINVVPNPYIMFSEYEVTTPGADDARLMFTHLPPEGTLRIFTVSGQFVQRITWAASDLSGNGDLFWNMRTREGNDVGGGLYVFVIEARNPATGEEVKKIGKFVVIR